MKTSNGTGAVIRHLTTNTGDRQAFDLTDENFTPEAIAIIPTMLEKAFSNFQINLYAYRREEVQFEVSYRGSMISDNLSEWDGEDIELETTLIIANLAPWLAFGVQATKLDAPGVLLALADLEQCAAIALLRKYAPRA